MVAYEEKNKNAKICKRFQSKKVKLKKKKAFKWQEHILSTNILNTKQKPN